MFERRMRSVVKLRFRNIHPATLPSSKHQSFRFCGQLEAATLSESSSRAHRTQLEENAAENGAFSSLSSAISQVEGFKPSILKCEMSPGVSISEEKSSPNVAVEEYEKLILCRSPVCEKAQQNISPVVDEIVAIIFAKDEIVPMEERLESSGLKFDSSIVEKVIKRCFKKPHSAWRFFHWAKLKDGISTTTDTYNTMLKIMGESKEFVLMEELMEEIENSSKNAETWRIPIYHFGNANLVDKTLIFFEKMKKYGPEPDVKVYSRLIDALCCSGKPDTAMELYKETVRKKIVLHVNTYKTLVAFMAKSGDAADVRSIADDMIRLVRTKTHYAYGHMLNCFCSAGKLTEALETLRIIVDKNLSLKPQSCEVLVKELSLVGRNKEAIEIVDMMTKRGIYQVQESLEIYAAKHTSESVLKILRNCKLHGQAALNFFNWVGKQESYSHTTETHEMAIKIAKNSVPDTNTAMEIFEEMIQTKHVPSKDLVATLLDFLCDTNRLTDARRCVELLTDVGYSTEQSYSLYIRALCRAQMMKQALEIVNEVKLKGEKLDSYAYASLVHGFLRKGNSEAALAKVEDMRQGGTNPTVHVYTPLMVHFFKNNQIDKATEIFEKMKAEGCDPTVVTYSVIVQGYINSGIFDEAMRVFNQMKEKRISPSFRIYQVLISGFCSYGWSEEAVVELLPEMFRNGVPPSLEIYRSIIMGLKSEGKHDLARKIQQRKMAFVDR